MTSKTDFSQAYDRLGEGGGEAWKPTKEGEKIAVRVKRIERRTVNTSQGPASTIVISGDDEKGRLRDVWAWHTVLRNELVNAAPQPGDVIAIEYLGKIAPQGGGNGYHGYKVRRADDAEGGAFDWGAAGPPADFPDAGFVPAASEPSTVEPPAEDDIPF